MTETENKVTQVNIP